MPSLLDGAQTYRTSAASSMRDVCMLRKLGPTGWGDLKEVNLKHTKKSLERMLSNRNLREL